MTVPQSLSNPSDKIIYQVGLNMLKHRQIEGVSKNLIIFSNYTFGSPSTSKNEPISWSITPNINTTKMTMGGLISLLCDVQLMDEDEDIEYSNEIKISIKMSHRVINRDRIEVLFKKIVTDRNNLTHHFDYFLMARDQDEESDNKILERLQNQYDDAEYLLKQLQQELSAKLDFIETYLKYSLETMTISQLADVFYEAYQSCKRSDGWAVWQQIMHFVYETSEAQKSIESLKKQKDIKSTKNILELIFPKWIFREEPTKNGSRILVQVDNTLVNTDSSFPEIIISD